MIIIYITCESLKQAEKIGRDLLEKRLCGCVNIIPQIISLSFWPPKTGKISKGEETILLVKTKEENFETIEKEVLKIHSWQTPCLFSLKIDHVNKNYYQWLLEEMK